MFPVSRGSYRYYHRHVLQRLRDRIPGTKAESILIHHGNGPAYTEFSVRLAAARRASMYVPVALYSFLNVAPDDGLMVVRNM